MSPPRYASKGEKLVVIASNLMIFSYKVTILTDKHVFGGTRLTIVSPLG